MIVTAFIAIAVFQGYNAVAPAAAEVPYPTLAGIAAVPIALGADQSLFAYIVGFLVLSVVVVDAIPDLILRPLLSGDATDVRQLSGTGARRASRTARGRAVRPTAVSRPTRSARRRPGRRSGRA